MGYTTPGEWHDLRSMRTEGDTYAEYVATLPMGLSWTVSDRQWLRTTLAHYVERIVALDLDRSIGRHPRPIRESLGT